MARLTVRLDDDLEGAFAALAVQHGGKAGLLRKLVTLAVTQGKPGALSAPETDKVAPDTGKRERFKSGVFSIRDADRIRALAQAEGMSAAEWFRALAMERLRDGKGAGAKASPPVDEDVGGRVVHFHARLRPREASALRRAASARGMLPGPWIRALIRVRLGKGTQYSAAEQLALRKLAVEVSRVGVNLNQLARGVNEARKMGKPLPADPAAVEMAKATVERALCALEKMARGNVRYWENGE